MLEYSASSTVAALQLGVDRHRRRDFSRFPPLLTSGTSVSNSADLQSVRPFDVRDTFAGASLSTASPPSLSSAGFLPEIETRTQRRSATRREGSGKRLLRKPTGDSKLSKGKSNPGKFERKQSAANSQLSLRSTTSSVRPLCLLISGRKILLTSAVLALSHLTQQFFVSSAFPGVSDPLDTMTTPLFSVRQCPRYDVKFISSVEVSRPNASV